MAAGSTYRWVFALAMALGVVGACTAVRAQGDGCIGNCDGDSAVTQSDLVIAVGNALDDSGGDLCDSLDASPADGQINVNEIVIGVDEMGRCPGGGLTPTPTQTRTPTPTATQSSAVTPMAQAIERNANGIALHAGDTLITEGVATVSAGVFANRKLKIFMQDGGAGIMVFHPESSQVSAFQAGDRLRVTGVISQDPDDPNSDNRALGTVAVAIQSGSAIRLSQGNPLPEPIPVDLGTLVANGNAYTGSLVRVNDVHKVAGEWPTVGQQSTQVTIGDTTGETIILRLQRFTISTPDLPNKLAAIGNDPFDLVSIAVQDDPDGSQPYLSGYELWIRGADDVLPIN